MNNHLKAFLFFLTFPALFAVIFEIVQKTDVFNQGKFFNNTQEATKKDIPQLQSPKSDQNNTQDSKKDSLSPPKPLKLPPVDNSQQNKKEPKVDISKLKSKIQFLKKCQEIYKKLDLCNISESCNQSLLQELKTKAEECDAKLLGI